MMDKTMTGEYLDNILCRLTCCSALLYAVHADMANGDICVDALYGVCDLLDGICRDFQADIEAAREAVQV